MIIDCHAHFEPRLLDEKTLIQRMDEARIDKMVMIPLMTNPPETKKSDFMMAVQREMFYSTALRPLGIAITKSMYKTKGQWKLWGINQETKTYSIVVRPDNDSTVALMKRHPDRFMGWIFVNPEEGNALEEIERLRSVPGMIGIKLHPFWHQYPMPRAAEVARRAQELNLPVSIHLGFGQAGDYEWLVDQFPNLKIIFSHLGSPFYKDLWKRVGHRKNVFFDFSSTYHVSEPLVKRAIKYLGPKKCMFATDSPYAHTDVMLRIRKWVDELPITDSERDLIYSKNFLSLIG
jgi:predicted TIM-barrel fold metal-dependent hydrolase